MSFWKESRLLSGRLKNLRVVAMTWTLPALRPFAEFILSKANVLQGDKGVVLLRQILYAEGGRRLRNGFPPNIILRNQGKPRFAGEGLK